MMKKVGIYYGSTTGTCEDVAKKLASKLNNVDVMNVTQFSEETIKQYDVLLLGTSTWGFGELQDDWFDACEKLKNLNLTGTTVALFCEGDCEMYPDSFCGALAPLYDAVKSTGATIVGQVSTLDYHFADSEGVVDGKFLGLALDDTNEADKTDARIDAWIASIGL